MASASTSHAEDEQESTFFSSGDESSDFEGFELDDIPLSSIAHANQQRESDSDQDMDDFLVESGDEDDSASESADEIAEEWIRILTPQTAIAFEERVGPIRNLPPDKKAIDFFELYFTQRLYRLIVCETNHYAGQEEQQLAKPLEWTELTVNELHTQLAMYFAMGIVQKPTFHSYWEKDHVTATPSFGNIMSRSKFMNILSFIHFVDNETEVPRDPAQHDCLFKIRSVLDELQRQFRQNYIPAREVSIDETMLKFKGRKFFHQFLPSKPIRFGFKLFILAESCTGYIWDFQVYTGKKGEAELNQTRNVVLRLMQPLEGKGYWLFTDNFYTGPEIYFSLRERSIQACGTVRPNRKGLPNEIMDHKLQLVKNLQHGECTFRQKGELVALTWKDKKPVHLILLFQ